MNPPESNDPIEKLLHEQAAYVADDGFTRRVVARLPRRRSLLPKVIPWVVVVAGTFLAGFWLPWESLPPLDYTRVFSLDPGVLSTWLPFVAVIVALVSTVVAALRREE